MKTRLNTFFQRFRQSAQGEQALLARGEAPESKIKNPLQRSAAKLIAGFFALMLAFTIVSRAAEGMTVATVQAEAAKSGTIIDRATLTGTIVPLEDLQMTLPANLYITGAKAEVGQKVEAGDVLLEFDMEDVQTQLEEQQNSLAAAEAKLAIAENGATTDTVTALASAQLTLQQAQEDYDRQEAKLERSAARAQEDYATAEADLETARENYTETRSKTKTEMITAAKTKMDSAKKSLEDTKTAASEAIDAAKYAYEQAKAKAEESLANGIKNAETALENAQTSAEESVATAQYAYDTTVSKPGTALEIQRALTQLQSAQTKAAKQIADAETALAEANAATLPEDVGRAYDSWQSTKTKQNAKTTEAQSIYNDTISDYNDAVAGTELDDQQAVVSAQNNVKSAEKALSNAKRSLEDNGQTVDDQLLSARRTLSKAQRDLDQAKKDAAEKERTAKNSETQVNIDKMTQRTQIAALKKTIATLEEIIDMEGQLASPIDGTVQEIAKAGKTQDKVAVATLSRNDLGFQFEAKTDSATAESLALDDQGNFTYRDNGASQRTQASIAEIGAADADGNCLIIAALPEGSYPSGASGTLTITRSGERQNTTIPVSALRSDSDGDYVFVLEEKKTVTGLEYSAKRLDVTVLDRDSSLVSVQGGMGREDLVITSASKPIAEGDRVRLEED